MDGARTNAPDLFAALAWAQRRVAAHSLVEIGGAAAQHPSIADPGAITPPDGILALADAPAAAAKPPAAPLRKLAEVLEPSGGESPALDEFESMLDELADTSHAPEPVPAPANPLPRRETPVATTSAPPARPRPVTPPAIARRAARARNEVAPEEFPAPGAPALLKPPAETISGGPARVSPTASPEGENEEVAPRRTGGHAWVWISLSIMLAGALVWVLYTQTDVFSGDVIAQRNAAALAEAVRERDTKQAELDAKAKQYGAIELETTPKGARVFDMRPGPEATFVGLPPEHEYLVLVSAPGYAPRIRRVKGSEMVAPVIVDLDALPQGAAEPPLPDEDPPKLAASLGKQTSALVLRSNTPGAQVGLLVGYTPGVKLIDVDVTEPKRLWIALPGHQREELVIKGRHYEELGSGALIFSTNLQLRPLPASEEPEVVVEPESGAGAPPPVATAPTPVRAKASGKKRRAKKKSKKRRR